MRVLLLGPPAAQVQHPNICRLLGVSTDGPERCLVLEMCPAGSLFGALAADRKRLAAGAAPALGWRARVQLCIGAALARVGLIRRALNHALIVSSPRARTWTAEGADSCTLYIHRCL